MMRFAGLQYCSDMGDRTSPNQRSSISAATSLVRRQVWIRNSRARGIFPGNLLQPSHEGWKMFERDKRVVFDWYGARGYQLPEARPAARIQPLWDQVAIDGPVEHCVNQRETLSRWAGRSASGLTQSAIILLVIPVIMTLAKGLVWAVITERNMRRFLADLWVGRTSSHHSWAMSPNVRLAASAATSASWARAICVRGSFFSPSIARYRAAAARASFNATD